MTSSALIKSLLVCSILLATVTTVYALERQLAGSSRTYEILEVTPGTRTHAGDLAAIPVLLEDCRTTFVPTSRPYIAAPGQPSRTSEPFGIPAGCRYRANAVGPYGIHLGNFESRSIHDLGTYTVSCPRHAPASLSCSSIATPNACGRFELCLPLFYGLEGSGSFDIEIYNNPPALSISHDGTGLLPGTSVAHDAGVDLIASASDSDPGPDPTVSWRIFAQPAASVSTLSTTSGDRTGIRFAGERDFGEWIFEAAADDNEGERVLSRYPLSVINQPPVPVISWTAPAPPGARVPFGEDIRLSVSPDEDGGAYTAILWEALAPGAATWAPVGSMPNLVLPTELASIGPWLFRVTVTDNDVPALTGTSADFALEVFNAPPELTVEPVASPVAAESGSFVIRANALDPDGGNVEISIRAIQTPDSAGVAPGTVLGRRTTPLDYVQPLSIVDAGTWIFELIARDNEPAPYTGESEPVEVTVVADGLPQAEIEGPERVGTLTGMLGLSGVRSSDPDTPCPDTPGDCHSTADGSPPRGITRGITRYTWTLIDASLDSGEPFPTGNVRELFTIRGPDDAIDIPLDELQSGLFTFQLEVRDGEGNPADATHRVEVIEEQTDPLSILSPPSRHTVSVIDGVTAPIVVDGTVSFDPDNLLTGDLPGITGYEWRVDYEPADCVARRAASESSARLTLWAPASLFPPACIGPYKLTLTVTDDDLPTAHRGSASTTVLINNCPHAVCIDLPTKEIPYKVEFADDTDVLIFYHVDPAAAALFPHGTFARLQIFHESNLTTPVFKSHSPNVSTSSITSLLVFHWNGYWQSGRPRPGRYHVQVELLDHGLGPATLPLTAYEANAIFIAVDELAFAADASRFVARDTLLDGTTMVNIPYTIDGSITPDRVVWRLRDAGGSEMLSRDLPPAFSGAVSWDGRVNMLPAPDDAVAPIGTYSIEVEAFRGGASLTGAVPHSFSIYRLAVEPVAGAEDDLTVMVNSDDDNLNGQPDSSDSGPISGETDLLAVRLIMDPPANGSLRVSTTDASPRFAMNSSANRASATTALPASYAITPTSGPTNVFIEGLSSGSANLRLEFIPDGAAALPAVEQTLRIIEIAVEDGSYADVNSVDIAQMMNAYATAPPYGLLNTTMNSFVDRDDDRFALRVVDAAADSDAGVADNADVTLSTIFANGVIDDNATRVPLFEGDGAGNPVPNSGVFQSRFQITVTSDLPTADDDIAAADGVGGSPVDDSPGDRTHRATIDGGIRIGYQPAGSARRLSYQLPICGRDPEQRRVVEIRARIFIDPTTGMAAATPSYVQDQLDRANLAWAPACIKFRLTGGAATTIPAASTPTVASPLGPVNFLSDAGNYGGAADRNALINAFATGAANDVFELFIVPNYAGANAVTYGPFDSLAGLGLKTLIVMEAGLPIYNRTLAHELGHALGNTSDSHNRVHIFYPARPFNAATDIPPNFGYSIDDRTVTDYRRISDLIITQSRTPRALAGPPPPSAVGNYALKRP